DGGKLGSSGTLPRQSYEKPHLPQRGATEVPVGPGKRTPPSGATRRRPRGGRALRRASRDRAGHGEREGRTPARLAPHAELAAVGLDDAAGDEEPEPRPSPASPPVP